MKLKGVQEVFSQIIINLFFPFVRLSVFLLRLTVCLIQYYFVKTKEFGLKRKLTIPKSDMILPTKYDTQNQNKNFSKKKSK